jgi:hypothetical protein
MFDVRATRIVTNIGARERMTLERVTVEHVHELYLNTRATTLNNNDNEQYVR